MLTETLHNIPTNQLLSKKKKNEIMGLMQKNIFLSLLKTYLPLSHNDSLWFNEWRLHREMCAHHFFFFTFVLHIPTKKNE